MKKLRLRMIKQRAVVEPGFTPEHFLDSPEDGFITLILQVRKLGPRKVK